MVYDSITPEVSVGSARGAEPRVKRSAASRTGANGPREIDRVRVPKAVTERDPRGAGGINPNSRWNRRRPARAASSHLRKILAV